ncbi:TetR/AcrR family transcriptional regulator [Paenibacillus mendelii]|uniref:TetR/AcrR family transcriptional regulator n=1 Tax=Paenibacillus mendelii TaxID=206163 RepID=A0ABV6J8W3_9BACL|nr:TetR/AcrR family transcriptional regulator [Paenibacillus mendelii]MCQ6559561.1 TetR/AcrR family transcriptional regulator [Paenibacillus mendelii]
MKNEERRELTIGQLLKAAKELVLEKGCDAITMKDIMDQSGLTKGAIFHYVKSKDEIFAWVLQEKLEETNQHFLNEVRQKPATFEGPMQAIAQNLASMENSDDVTNKVLVYLLGKENNPAVAEVLQKFYEKALSLSLQWITAGQQHGVIPESVDPQKTSELFVLMSIGLRVRSTFSPPKADSYTAQDLSAFIAASLKA